MSTREEAAAFQERLARIETLIEEVQTAANPALQTRTDELLAALMELHGVGLKRILDLIWDSGEAGKEIVHGPLAHDAIAGGLLLVHDLHPLPLASRVEQALETVRPYLASHGGDVELVDIFEGRVRLRLHGTCGSCPASSVTLRYAVEDAIYEVAPDVLSVEAVGMEDEPVSPGFIPLPLASNGHESQGDGNWHDVDDMIALAPRTPQARKISGRSVLFLRMGEHLYAYNNACPSCQEALDAANLDGTALVCPSCGLSYDVIRAGRGLDKPSESLEPIPLLIEKEHVRIALPA
ncbi:MAG TPA: NifU family protein [Rhodothermales bacterium]|nr:NifU family protein [Rhodothermales bacterium]